jgi:hypothetical protein
MRHGMADECRARAFDGDFPASIVVVERESDFESDLVMRHLAVFDMAARLQHFEPANLPQRARRTPDGGLDRVLDALFRRARDLDDSVNMVRHRHPPVGQWLGSPDLQRLQAFFSRLAHIKWTPSFCEEGAGWIEIRSQMVIRSTSSSVISSPVRS